MACLARDLRDLGGAAGGKCGNILWKQVWVLRFLSPWWSTRYFPWRCRLPWWCEPSMALQLIWQQVDGLAQGSSLQNMLLPCRSGSGDQSPQIWSNERAKVLTLWETFDSEMSWGDDKANRLAQGMLVGSGKCRSDDWDPLTIHELSVKSFSLSLSLSFSPYSVYLSIYLSNQIKSNLI